jgi:GTP-binding protein Era
MNHFLGEKVAITAAKPQTTRHKVLGVLTEPGFQLIFWDTPGYHLSERLLNREMLGRTLSALADADVVLWLADGRYQGSEHEATKELVLGSKKENLVAAISKSDLASKESLSELKELIRSELGTDKVIEVSAKTGANMGELKKLLVASLPIAPPLYPDDTLTDQPMRLIASEFVREAVFRLTKAELPYSSAVTVEEYKEAAPDAMPPRFKTYIAATIHVEKNNQKMIMIGNRGQMLSKIGISARESLEKLLGNPVYLKLFVRVTKDWSKKKSSIKDFGYGD